MRTKTYSFIILLLLSFSVYATPKIENWTTANGARVYFVAAHEIPIVDVRIVFDAGAARDGDLPGVALMTNGMIPEGAANWDANKIAERFEDVGAEFSNSSHRDMSVFSLRTLTDRKLYDQAVDTFATVLSKPTFPQKAFDRERKRLLIGLEQKKESPDAIAEEKLFATVYASHPYSSPPEGTETSVKAMQRSDLEAFYKQYMVARNAVVAIVGDVDDAEARKLAERVVGQLAEGKVAEQLPHVAERQKAEKVVVDFPSTQTQISIAQPGVTRDDPDYFPLFVGNHVLGGSGLVSILSDEIREKRGLSYSIYSYFSPMRVEGPFMIGLKTRNDQTQKALSLVQETLKKFVQKGPSESQLTAAKKNLVGGFALRLSSNKKIIDQVAAMGFYGIPLDYLDTYIAKIKAVSREQIVDAFQRRVHPDKMVTVIVGAQNQKQASN